jgi:hypothetical protein
VGHVRNLEEMRNANKIWIGKPEGMRRLRKLSHNWEDNKIKLVEIEEEYLLLGYDAV